MAELQSQLLAEMPPLTAKEAPWMATLTTDADAGPSPAIKALDNLHEAIADFDRESSSLNTIFNTLFGKQLPMRACKNAEELKDLTFEIQKVLNASAKDITKLGEESAKKSAVEKDSLDKESAAEKAHKEGVALQGKFDLQKSSIGRMWKRHLKENGTLKTQYEAIGKSYEKQREFRAKWNETEYKLCKVPLTNHGRPKSNLITTR